MEATKRKPHRNWPGYQTERKHGGTYAVVVDGREAWLDTTEGRWQVICSEHGAILSATSLREARVWMRAGTTEWCDCCRGTCTDVLYGASCISCGRA